MPNSKVDLKNPLLAAFLAYLIPGAGHLYQGRIFKAAIYSTCILGTFFWGMHLGQWKIVYKRWEPGNRNLGYLSQVLVGLPAIPAYFQSKRYQSQFQDFEGRRDLLGKGERRLSAPFHGVMPVTEENGDTVKKEVKGEITLEKVEGRFNTVEVRGTFIGTVEGQGSQTLQVLLDGIKPKIFADEQRKLSCEIIEEQNDETVLVGRIEGVIPRDFWDWFEVPLEDEALQNLNGQLGKFFELAQVFTWIAGLLNLLAVWDALEGPAYGYGDEEPGQRGQDEEQPPASPASSSSTTNSPAQNKRDDSSEVAQAAQKSTAASSQS